MVKCSFCNDEIKPGTGKVFVAKDGKKIDFCSRKCEKNMIKLGRNARNLLWITKKK